MTPSLNAKLLGAMGYPNPLYKTQSTVHYQRRYIINIDKGSARKKRLLLSIGFYASKPGAGLPELIKHAM